jgi:hypothetical protein
MKRPFRFQPHTIMYYEDQARRFNLLSGFLVGTVLGAGIGLLSGSLGSLQLPVRRRKTLGQRLGAYGEEARGAVASAVRQGARTFGR